jgi:hypothetical protein
LQARESTINRPCLRHNAHPAPVLITPPIPRFVFPVRMRGGGREARRRGRKRGGGGRGRKLDSGRRKRDAGRRKRDAGSKNMRSKGRRTWGVSTPDVDLGLADISRTVDEPNHAFRRPEMWTVVIRPRWVAAR